MPCPTAPHHATPRHAGPGHAASLSSFHSKSPVPRAPASDADFEPNGNDSNPDRLQQLATATTTDGTPIVGFIASENDQDVYAIEITGETLVEISLIRFRQKFAVISLVSVPNGISM